MTFAWPQLLWLLLAPAALLAWELTRVRRGAARTTHPKILRAQAGARSVAISEFKTENTAAAARARAWLAAGLTLAVVALARPQWGRIEEPVFDQSREILLALDLSRSMLTPDVKPARLDRAKLLITSLLEKLSGERVGLVVFSGTAFLQSPLSSDYEILREFLPALGPDFLPEGGTNYRALLDTSIQAFGSTAAADRFLIVLSDGEATEDDWRGRLDELKKKGIRVIGLGVGTTTGAMIPDGAGGLVKDERGAVVMSKLESATLQELARATGGAYRDASAWVDLAGLVKETVDAGRKGKFVEKNTVRLVDRFQWPLALGLWCLLVSFCYEFPVRPRPRAIKLAPAAKPTAVPAATAAAAATLLLSALFITFPTHTRAQVSLGPKPRTSAVGGAGSPAEQSSALARIVGRLSATATRDARDWSEFGHETVTWGSRLQSEQQPVPEGPVRDALAAVDLGSKLDPKVTDWPKLREELEALLQKKDEDKKDQQQQQQSDKNQPQQNQDQKNQNQQKQDQPQNSPDSSPQKQDSPQPQDAKPNDPQKNSGESAFGDMKQHDQPPPPPSSTETQKVGGEANEKKAAPAEPVDPTLAVPLQKLDQLRDQDNPVRLFQLMEGEKKPTAKKPAKDW